MNGHVSCPSCHESNSATANYCRVCGILIKPAIVTAEGKCPFCASQVVPDEYFCSNCGRGIRRKLPSVSLSTQLGIYLVSLILPPFGLFQAFKYLRESDSKRRSVGIIAILLTAVSLVIVAVTSISLINTVNEQVNRQVKNLLQF